VEGAKQRFFGFVVMIAGMEEDIIQMCFVGVGISRYQCMHPAPEEDFWQKVFGVGQRFGGEIWIWELFPPILDGSL
jgi:hypothetical protein